MTFVLYYTLNDNFYIFIDIPFSGIAMTQNIKVYINCKYFDLSVETIFFKFVK